MYVKMMAWLSSCSFGSTKMMSPASPPQMKGSDGSEAATAQITSPTISQTVWLGLVGCGLSESSVHNHDHPSTNIRTLPPRGR